ncbi:MAG: hypothetical protein FWG44_08425 [Oscillospiraceae bacterium]|nr:hypothetical protein [Oscillospiraceae bacterium]
MRVCFFDETAARAARNTEKRVKSRKEEDQPIESKKIVRLQERLAKIRERIRDLRADTSIPSEVKDAEIKQLTESINVIELEIKTLVRELQRKKDEANGEILNTPANKSNKRDTFERDKAISEAKDEKSAMELFVEKQKAAKAEAAAKAEEEAAKTAKKAENAEKYGPIKFTGLYKRQEEETVVENGKQPEEEEELKKEENLVYEPGYDSEQGGFEKILTSGANTDEIKTVISTTKKLQRDVDLRKTAVISSGVEGNADAILKMQEQIRINKTNPLRGLLGRR